MPVGGILKKSSSRPGPPPPLPPIVIHSSGGDIRNPPPKPRRFLSRAADEATARVLLFIDDDDEPKTEDSYDYKDIDFAAEVYEFKPFPPRPKPPRKRPSSPPPVSNDMEFGEVDRVQTNGKVADQPIVQSALGELDISNQRLIDGRMALSAENVASDNLVRFLKEHEGRSLSVEDVVCLGRILDEHEDDVKMDERRRLLAGVDGEQKLNQTTVHFGDAEILEGMTDEEDIDRTTTTSDDYSEMEFQHVRPVAIVNGTVVKDYGGGYEPVGKPYFLDHLKQQRPDLSEYVAPVPSTIVGDPFSWRRRGRRRLCDYGYDRKADYWSTSALDKINDGCQEIEDAIVARDLTPPGTLLRTLGGGENKRRKRAEELMAPPLPPKLRRTPSPCCDSAVPDDVIVDLQRPITDDDVTVEEKLDEETIVAKLEAEIITETETEKADVVAVEVLLETNVTTEDPKVDQPESEIEPPTRPPRRDVAVLLDDQSTVDAEVGNEVQIPLKRASRRDVFERGRERPPRPPPPTLPIRQPVRPLRRKRFRSAELAMTLEVPSSATISTPNLLVLSPTNSNKPQRSASFHTAEDIRRRIDVQAQHFLRTPRRRDGFASSSCSLKYDRLRRNRSPAPLYSLVNKGRIKMMTSCGSQTDLTGHSPTPPVPPPPKDEDFLETALQQYNDWADIKRLETATDEEDQVVVLADRQDVSSLPANRPLPAPPPPHRRNRFEKTGCFPLSAVVLACAHHDGGVVAGGKMSIAGVPEMKVLRLTVGHLEASTLRVTHMEADVFKANAFEHVHLRRSPDARGGASNSSSGHVKDAPDDNSDFGEKKVSTPEDDGEDMSDPTVVSPNKMSVAHQQRPHSFHRDSLPDTISLTTVTLNDDPFTAMTTSDSASYVTCDETLQDDDYDVGFTDDLLDEDFDLNLELDGGGEDEEDAATGCPTPTELEMDVNMITQSPAADEINCNVGMRMALTPDSISSSSSSSSSGVEGIVKMRKMKLKGRLADNTNSWYDDGDVPGQVADNDVSDHRRHQATRPAASSLFESGSTSVKPPSWTKDADNEDNDDDDASSGEVEAGSLIKQRIAVLFDQSQSGGSTGSGGSVSRDHRYRRSPDSRRKCRPKRPRSKFYLTPTEESPQFKVVVNPSEEEDVSPTAVESESVADRLKVSSLLSVSVSTVSCVGDDVDGDVLEGSSSEEEEDENGSVASSSSPRNLSAYSESAFVSFGNDDVPKRSRAFQIARELMTSEKVFVDVLNLLTKDFLEAIDKATAKVREPIVPDDVLGQILDCLPQLKSFNEDLLKDLEERIEKWDEVQRVSDVIVCKGPFLKLYTMYIKKFPVLTNNLDEACKKFPQFALAVKDFEMSDRCKRLELKHYMLKPVQRIPQYRMLLQDYLKNIEPDSPDFAYTQAALAIVSEVANHANDSMKEGDKFAKLLQIQSRIAGNHEVIKPGRMFIREGELLKLCRKEMQLRTFILFTDSLLHLSFTTQGLLRVHHELPLSNMKVSVPTQEDFQNEFSVISVARSFTLAAGSPVERDEWISELSSAIQKTVSRHASFLQAKLHQLHIPEHGNKNEALGEQAPVWIPDSRVTMCQLCLHEFTLTFRRHHCRACGKVVCAICSANRAPLFYRNYETARVCDECFIVLKKEIEDRASFNEVALVSRRVSEPDNSAGGDNLQRSRMPSLDDLKAQFKKYYRGGSAADQKHKRQLPRVLKEVCANDTGSSMSGYLYKRLKRTWRRGWFVIKDKVLYSYKASQDVAALDSTPLLGFDVITFTEPRDGIHHQLIFELRHPGYPSMDFYAESLKSAERWLEVVRRATVLE